MTVHLPPDIERSIEAAVTSGRFASMDDAMTEAGRLLLRRIAEEDEQAGPTAKGKAPAKDPILGLMRDDAALMDEIVADAYRRREEPWRDLDL